MTILRAKSPPPLYICMYFQEGFVRIAQKKVQGIGLLLVGLQSAEQGQIARNRDLLARWEQLLQLLTIKGTFKNFPVSVAM